MDIKQKNETAQQTSGAKVIPLYGIHAASKNMKEMESKDEIRAYVMDKHGKHSDVHQSTVILSSSTKAYIVLGWISAALTGFYSFYFAIAAIAFGMLANHKVKGIGNTLIITTVIFAMANFMFQLLWLWMLG